ncbi:MAG TPA: hypothetical protein VLB85_03435 [Acidimicrobiia bacterium]|nr:hypothetical protein [Acidimicrobiia bacterium]
MLNIDSHIYGPTDVPSTRRLAQVEAAHQRATQQRTALLIVAANVVGIALLLLTTT